MKNNPEPVSTTLDTLAMSITRTASLQTYLTIRLLVDREHAPAAFKAYAYFRWVDDTLDSNTLDHDNALAFLARQQMLLNTLAAGPIPQELCPQEQMLADLLQTDREPTSGLQAYLHHMMAVMAFDANRRGQQISQAALDDYVAHLSIAVTEAMHYFIGHDQQAAHGAIRHQAVMGAHITHMLRDLRDDLSTGYINIPTEYLNTHQLDPQNIHTDAFRQWVQQRVAQARVHFCAGRVALSQAQNLRCRLAGYLYMARFEQTLHIIEADGYQLRATYPEPKQILHLLPMLAYAIWQATILPIQRSASWALQEH